MHCVKLIPATAAVNAGMRPQLAALLLNCSLKDRTAAQDTLLVVKAREFMPSVWGSLVAVPK